MDEPRWLDERQLRAWESFLALGSILNRRIEQQLRDDAGLTHPQYEVLVRLADAPGREMRMADLACAATTSKSSLSYQVTQLEKAGLVRRRSCPTDVRGIIATLTDAGWDALRESAPGHAAIVRDLFVSTLTGEQFDGLAIGLDALLAALREPAPEDIRTTPPGGRSA